MKEIAADAFDPGQAAARHGGRACSPPRSTRRRSRIIRTAATSAKSRSTWRPAKSRSCATAWSTTSAPCSIRCCCTARSTAASRKAPGQALMEDIHFDAQRPVGDRLVHGLRHAARARFLRHARSRAIRCRPRPIRSAPRARAKPAASARCRRWSMRWSMRLSRIRRQAHRDAGDVRAHLARDADEIVSRSRR